jgi:hypothetical protein
LWQKTVAVLSKTSLCGKKQSLDSQKRHFELQNSRWTLKNVTSSFKTVAGLSKTSLCGKKQSLDSQKRHFFNRMNQQEYELQQRSAYHTPYHTSYVKVFSLSKTSLHYELFTTLFQQREKEVSSLFQGRSFF